VPHHLFLHLLVYHIIFFLHVGMDHIRSKVFLLKQVYDFLWLWFVIISRLSKVDAAMAGKVLGVGQHPSSLGRNILSSLRTVPE
jgi:hypothetical protein